MMQSDIPLKLFFGLVALAIVGRDQETGSIPAQDFRLRFRHWDRTVAGGQTCNDGSGANSSRKTCPNVNASSRHSG